MSFMYHLYFQYNLNNNLISITEYVSIIYPIKVFYTIFTDSMVSIPWFPFRNHRIFNTEMHLFPCEPL